MAVYATYTQYTTTYGGTAIASTAWTRLSIEASAEIDRQTFDRAAAIVTAATDTDTIAQIVLATCAVAETLQTQENAGGAIISESIGSHSVTYAHATSATSQLVSSARRYLAGTGLMYRGFNTGEYSTDGTDEDE